jgi:hypothetical protein
MYIENRNMALAKQRIYKEIGHKSSWYTDMRKLEVLAMRREMEYVQDL